MNAYGENHIDCDRKKGYYWVTAVSACSESNLNTANGAINAYPAHPPAADPDRPRGNHDVAVTPAAGRESNSRMTEPFACIGGVIKVQQNDPAGTIADENDVLDMLDASAERKSSARFNLACLSALRGDVDAVREHLEAW